MQRRQALTALAVAPIAGLPALPSPTKVLGQKTEGQSAKYLVVIYLGIGDFPPHKVEAFVDRIKERFATSKPENINFVILPKRVFDHSAEVFALDGSHVNCEVTREWLRDNIDNNSLKQIFYEEFHRDWTDSEILGNLEYIIKPWTARTIGIVKRGIELGRKHRVCHLLGFVRQYTKDCLSEENLYKSVYSLPTLSSATCSRLQFLGIRTVGDLVSHTPQELLEYFSVWPTIGTAILAENIVIEIQHSLAVWNLSLAEESNG